MYQYRLKEIKVGDTEIKKGVKTTVSSIDPETGAITYDVENVADFTSTYQELEKAKDFLLKLEKTGKSKDDPAIDRFAAQIKDLFNTFRTHIRKNYPEEYSKFQTAENIDPKSQAKHKGKSAPFGSAYEPVKEINEELGVSKRYLTRIADEVGESVFAQMILNLRDENVQDEIVDAFEDQYPVVRDFKNKLNEARYSQFKTETKLRTPTEQIHRAVREIRRKIDEMVKVVGHTERMKSELKGSNEGMSYLKRTRNAINTISEKLQELNNRIKGLTE